MNFQKSFKEMRDGTIFGINISHFMNHKSLKLDFHNRVRSNLQLNFLQFSKVGHDKSFLLLFIHFPVELNFGGERIRENCSSLCNCSRSWS